MVACLDPYHDNQLRLEGMPDIISAPSIVKMHNQSYTLTAPASAAGGDWDATVAFTGATGEIGLNATLSLQGQAQNDFLSLYDHVTGAPAAPLLAYFNSFVVKAGASGSDLKWGSTVANATNQAFGACSQSPNSDRCRIIAVAFEVTNTTAEVYRQGSVTVAALPSPVSDYGTVTMVDTNAAPYPPTTFQSWYSPKFAANRTALLSVPGAATWAAKDGVYAIPRLSNMSPPCDCPSSNKRAVVVQDSTTDVDYCITVPGAFLGAVLNYPIFNGMAQSGFGAVQAFFTGLSNQTSLTLTMRTIVEYFPTFNSPLLPLTTPSPSFCPKAFEVYSSTVQLAPYAVPVKMNSAGEYFRRVLRIASNVGEAIAPFAGSFSPMVSSLASGAGAMVKHLDRRAAEKAVAKGKASAYVPKSARVARDEAGARAMPSRR